MYSNPARYISIASFAINDLTTVDPLAIKVVKVIDHVSQNGIAVAAVPTDIARKQNTMRKGDMLLMRDIVRWLCSKRRHGEKFPVPALLGVGFGAKAVRTTRDRDAGD